MHPRQAEDRARMRAAADLLALPSLGGDAVVLVSGGRPVVEVRLAPDGAPVAALVALVVEPWADAEPAAGRVLGLTCWVCDAEVLSRHCRECGAVQR